MILSLLGVFLRAAFASRETSPSEKQLLTIYDLDNKFIAYSAPFDDIIDVLAEWGSFYVLTRDGKMFVLQEKDTQTKLEVPLNTLGHADTHTHRHTHTLQTPYHFPLFAVTT